jgi:hypothetical protein
MRCYCIPTLLVSLLLTAPVWGQAVPSKEPTSTHIFPAGGRRGTVVPVRVGAECLPPGARFHLWGEGVSGPPVLGPRARVRHEPSAPRLPLDANFMNYPKEWEARVEIKANAPLGPCFWRVTTGWGGTQVRTFLVGDLPEFIETEPNSDPDHAQRITLPVVVNGQIAGERDVDYFLFAARAGEVVVCDVMAGRIGSPLDPVIELRDGHGRCLAGDEVRMGNDPVRAFAIPADGDYSLQVANLGVGGGPEYVYRITLSTAPYVYSAFPAGGRGGATCPIEFLALTGKGTPRTFKEKVAIPAGPARTFWQRLSSAGNPIPLLTGDLPEVTEPETNHSAVTALELTLPVTVNGRFGTATEEDWFRFAARKGEAYTIDCRPFPPGSPAVPVVALEDGGGAVLAQASGVEAPGRRCHVEWRAPADGAFRLRLRDLQQGTRGGPDFVYRLTVSPARPDFALTLKSDSLNVTQGARTELEVIVARTGGFTGPIDLAVTGLPAGVRIEGNRIPDNVPRHRISLLAGDDARPTDGVLRIAGTATVAGQRLERTATAVPLALETEGMSPAAPALPEVRLTVQHKPVFHLTCSEAYQYAHRGSIYPYRMQVERLNGFEGEIRVQLCDRQVQDLDGIEVVEQVIPRGAKEFDNLIYFPETMHASVQHHCRPYVQGYATFTDKWGQTQTLVGISDRRCMVRTRPPVVKLRSGVEAVVARPDTIIECPLALERTSLFSGPMQIVLIEPPPGVGLAESNLEIAAGKDSVRVRLKIGKETSRSQGMVKFRATAKIAGGATAVSEAVVALKWE